MELDFSEEWRLVRPRHDDHGEDPGSDGPEAFAASELATILGRMGCRITPVDEADAAERLIVLNAGHSTIGTQNGAAAGGRRRSPFFSWRAAESLVEIYGEDGGALLRGAYSFLDALGVRWVEPGEEGERLPRGPVLDLAESSRRADSSSVPTTLILGHGAFLERWEEYFLWAARVGYSSIFIHTTPECPRPGRRPGEPLRGPAIFRRGSRPPTRARPRAGRARAVGPRIPRALPDRARDLSHARRRRARERPQLLPLEREGAIPGLRSLRRAGRGPS